MSRALAGAACVLLAAAAGCSSNEPPAATDHTPDAAGLSACRQVFAALPTTVGGATGLLNQAGRVAYWGDGEHRVVLRCGIERPAGLEASSRCDVVNGVGWWAEKTEAGYRFTTIGRAAFLQVEVPSAHAPEADVLNELSGAVSQDPVVTPCS
ncbi:DUF3515 family protein [Aestuariimicrobium soli]|uniref:DUF3515 family protein n=1 Tax=Aestuariimicrobium soli TaxID=2035834 RepID=UPI003EB80B98